MKYIRLETAMVLVALAVMFGVYVGSVISEAAYHAQGTLALRGF